MTANLAALHYGLRRKSLAERRDAMIEYHWARGKYDQLLALAAELVPPPSGYDCRHARSRLARSENIITLGNTLGNDLELEAQEKAVGHFAPTSFVKAMERTIGF